VAYVRHTYLSTLKDNGEDVKVLQELRHASTKVTLDIYAQAHRLSGQRSAKSSWKAGEQDLRADEDVRPSVTILGS
jgi:hypothetical protein